MSWQLLERFFESDHFNNDPSLAVAYLARYADHIGIQYALCNKLRQFAYEEIEFFLPQLCHLLVSVENDSMALEEFIIDLCQESVSGALIVCSFSHGFSFPMFPQDKRVFEGIPRREPPNRLVGAKLTVQRPEKIHENILPTTVLASIVLAGVAAPFFPRHLGPLAIAQARRPRPPEETISEAPHVQKLSRSATVTGPPARVRRTKSAHTRTDSEQTTSSKQGKSRRSANAIKTLARRTSGARHVSLSEINGLTRLETSSLPDFTESLSRHVSSLEAPATSNSGARSWNEQRNTHDLVLSQEDRVHALRAHYFRSETAFLSALEGISNRLVVLPKPARLSALRAELALIARDLPAEVDVPGIYPATLADGIPSRSKHHRIVRLNPAEATSLNSAERVPYLLMVEVLREDFDFDPGTEANQQLLASLAEDKDKGKRLFDITHAAREEPDAPVEMTTNVDSVFEPALGDLSSPDLLQDFSDGVADDPRRPSAARAASTKTPPRLSSSTNTVSSYSLLSTPRMTDAPLSRAASPGLNKLAMGKQTPQAADQPDFSALATHMRTAAQMLAQLDISGSKRPRQEVEAIKSKIVASMQNLEEQSFTNDDTPQTFDKIFADSTPGRIMADLPDEGSEQLPDTPDVNTGVGAARMENDQKTGGVRRPGDRDDPSAATFGEDWNSKRDRIRRTSPYGWMKNWDLVSVIVKTGSDLRQELFACQMIRICAKIWEDAGVPVWVKQMRILVTGESSGLIETITNGVSLHSLKRSLTLSSIAAGTNPRKRFATLKDHFSKTFGAEDSATYRTALDSFIRSLAAYSMLSYILQLKDRHNGNILIDNMGHIIHIDFGFMLSNSPGSVGFEAAPFKLTHEYVEVLGGVNSPGYRSYVDLCKAAFQALRKSAENIVMVVELMGKESKMDCFGAGALQTTTALRQRFMLHLTKEEAEVFVETDLVQKSLGSYYTRLTSRLSVEIMSKLGRDTITLNNGHKMPVVGFGLWKVTNATCADQSSFNATNTSTDYGNEKEAGEGINRAIKDGLVKREDLFIVSKLWNSFHDKEQVKPICKRQLADYGIDYFDLYVIHFPIALKYVDPSIRYPPGWSDADGKTTQSKTPLHVTYAAMEDLVDDKLARSIGVSNYSGGLMVDLLRYARIAPATLQIEHHPYLTQPGLLKLCKDNGIAVTAYSSFGPQSFLELDMKSAKDAPLLMENAVVTRIAEGHSRTPAQVLLRWATQRGVAVIPKSNNQGRLEQNLDVTGWDLKTEELDEISALDRHLRFNNPPDYGVAIPIFA
ncbi:hypothetical protein FH972_023889 [Carpinus fangiana]|uniref:1-phosphatidylinositol 4-kinase n=1 Tax=Carpinus fangiana TaxID=176857 RepID=A0A5N6KWU7_9ROSI|nr:hypothetical protein FH972_023889 [Carpinus fangiana]